MKLLQVVMSWAGGTGGVLVTGLRGGAVVFGPGGATIPAELSGPFPVQIEMTFRQEPPGIEVDSALVQATDLTAGGHVLEFEGADITRRFTLEAGSYTIEVPLAPSVIEQVLPIVAPLMVMGMMGVMVVSMSRGRK